VLELAAALIKALLYGALLSAAGAPLAVVLLRPPAVLAEYSMRLMRLASIAVIALSIVAAVLLFVRLGGAFDQPTLTAVFSSGPGAALALQTAGAALLLTPTDDDLSGHVWRVTGVLTMLAAFAFNGHAAAMSPATGLVAMVHVLAASWWVGSLWLLRRACVGTPRDELVMLVRWFSWYALFVVAGLIVAGIVLIVALIDFSASPWVTDYVLTLALKLALVAFVLGLAAYNKFQLTPRLPQATELLRRSITIELGVIACVLTTTAVLTTYFSPES
jgi:putative copper resistance protein D